MKSVLSFSPRLIRVLLLGNNQIVVSGLSALLENDPGIKVTGTAIDHAGAVAALRERPEIIIFDADFRKDLGLSFLPELMNLANEAQVLILTGLRDPEFHLRAIRLGAKGVVLKQQPIEILIRAIQKVHSGHLWLGEFEMADLIGRLLQPAKKREPDPEADRIALLTEREREVISLLSEGLKNKRVAERLFICETTVRHHLTSIFGKLGVKDRLELVVYAYKHGLADPSLDAFDISNRGGD